MRRAALLLVLLAAVACAYACSPVLSCSDMQGLVKKYFPASYQTDMLCIAYYESSWCPTVYNGVCCWGLWQINQNHLGEPGCPSNTQGLQNADENAACAAHVLSSQGLGAWTTWTNGDCRGWNKCTAEMDNTNGTLHN